MPPFLMEDYLSFENMLHAFTGKNEFFNRGKLWKYILDYNSSNWYTEMKLEKSVLLSFLRIISQVFIITIITSFTLHRNLLKIIFQV